MAPTLFSETVITIIVKFTCTNLPVTGDSDRLGTIIYVVAVKTFAILAGKAHLLT